MGKRKYENESNGPSKRNKTYQSDQDIENTDADTKQPQKIENVENQRGNPGNVGGFDVKYFRKELAAKQGQTMVLTQFLQVCLNPDNEVDYLLEYLKTGGNSHEILRQVSQENKKNLSLATPAFHLFYLIILKVQDSLPHMIAITEEACRYFINNFMSTIEIMISENSGPRHRKIILKLFTSMVTLNSDLGIEILSQALFTPKNLQHIIEKPNYKEKDNVRTAFVHFVTSFLIDGHLPLIKALLEKQGLLALVIPGLVHDDAEAVMFFLNILKNNVVDNPLISKSLKLKAFSHQALHEMFKVFGWKGSPEVSHDLHKELRSEIMKILSNILLTLFTSHKLGLYFTDNSLGTVEVHKNQNLYKALLMLKKPWENENECKTILEIISKCPDLHRAIVNVVERNFEPQHSPIWEKTVEFVLKLQDTLRPEKMIPKMTNLSPTQVSNFVRFVTLPLPIVKFLNRDLGKDLTISTYCMKVLVKLLQTLKQYMNILETEESRASLKDLVNKLEYFFPKHMPSPSAIVGLVNEVIESKDNTKSHQAYSLPKIDKTESLTYLIDVLLLYNDIQPAFFETLEDNIDMKKILDYSKTLENGNTSLLKFKVVSLWLMLDSTVISVKNPMFKELFMIMLEVYTSDMNNTWIEAKDTLYTFFRNTSIFEADEDEIHVILYVLRNAKVNPISLIGEVVEYVLTNIIELNDYVRNQLVHFDISNETSEASLDRLFADLMDGHNQDGNMFLEDKVPTPFIVGCMQYVETDKVAKKSLKQFLSLYIVNLFHCNYSPDLTQALIGDSKLEVKSYVTSWLSKPVPLPETIADPENILFNISESIAGNADIPLPNVFPFLEECINEEIDVVWNDMNKSYQLNISTNIDSSEFMVWTKYLLFCTVRLTNMDQLQDHQQKKITGYFKLLLNIGKKQHNLINVCRSIIQSLFKNRFILNIYKVLDSKGDTSHILATKFLLEIVEEHNDIVNYLNKKHKILKSFQHKNYIEIIKAITKIKKKKNMNNDHTMKILDIIGLTKEDDLQIFNKILNSDIDLCVKDDKEPSLLLEVLQALIEKYSKSLQLELPQHILRKSMKLYVELLTNKDVVANLTNLEHTFIQYIERKPHEVVYFTEDIFNKFFHVNVMRKSTSALASIMLKFNPKFCNVFKRETIKPEILSQRELTLPLGNAVLSHKQFLIENKALLTTVFKEYKSNIIKLLEKPHKAGQIYINNWKFIQKLILECMEPEDCKKIFTKNQKYDIVEVHHIQLLETTFLKMCFSEECRKKEYFINYLLSMLHVTTIALKDNKDYTILSSVISNIYNVVVICKSFESFATEHKDGYQRIIESSVWQNFCKVVLKDSLKIKKGDQELSPGSQLLFLLSSLVKLLYPSDHQDVVLLFDMVTSHSEFLNVMLSHHSSDIKSSLIEFIFTLVQSNRSVMKLQQVPVYLSSYRATRSSCDRLILAILHYYEKNGLPVNEYKPYVFGDSAANYYAVRKSRNSTLWGHPTPNRVLSLFEKDIIERTVKHFPVNQKLDYQYTLTPNIDSYDTSGKSLIDILKISKDGVFKSKQLKDNESALKVMIAKNINEKSLMDSKEDPASKSHVGDDTSIYDPVFLFPLLSHLLAPGSVASCFKLLRTGLLSVPVMALSSHCPLMRAAAYHVLHRFCLLLETETKHKNDKLFLTDFINTLRNSLTTAISNDPNEFADKMNPRLPAIDALYLARALMVSTAPFDPLYKPVNNFFIAKQTVDLTVVPDFLNLFHDSDVESTDRRLWILDVIRDGTKTMTDVNVIFKTMCLKMIMDFYSSALSDRKVREKILGVVNSLVSIPRAFEILVEGYGLVSWLHSAVNSMTIQEISLFKIIISILKNMLNSMTINAFSKNVFDGGKNGRAVIGEIKVNKDVEQEIMVILYNLLKHTNGLELEQVYSYVNVYSVFSKRTVKLLTKKQMLTLVTRSTAMFRDSESVTLLKKAVLINDATVLSSTNISNFEMYPKDIILKELAVIVHNYIV